MKAAAPLLIPLVSLLLVNACSQSPLAPASEPISFWSVFATIEEPQSISGTSNDNVYALGPAGTLFHYDGLEWSVSMPFDGRLYWDGLWCVSPQDIFAFGYSRYFDYPSWSFHYDYYLYHFDGSAVSAVDVRLPALIHDLWGSSGQNMFVVGGGGMILHYDGTSWQPMESGTTEDVLSVWGLPTGEVFAALQHSILYYDGFWWREIFTTSEILHDIWASSSSDVYAVGDNGVILHYDGQTWTPTRLSDGRDLFQVLGIEPNDVYVGGYTNSALYHFDGVNWLSTPLPTVGFVNTGLWASSAVDVFAVGYGNEPGVPPAILHFDGTAWHRESVKYFMPWNRDLTAISGNDQYLNVGADYSAIFRFDGESWRGGSRSDGDYISDIWTGPGNTFVASASNGCVYSFDGARWARTYCGGEVAHVWASSLDDVFLVAEGEIAHFDGRSWQSMGSGTTVALNDVWGRSNVDIYAVGDSGTVLHYDGQSWQRMLSNTSENLQSIWGDSGKPVVVGAHGTILHFQDGQWVRVDCPTTKNLTGIWGASSDDIYAAGPRVVLHYDGSRWEILSDTLGGKQIWGRPGDGLYMVATLARLGEPENQGYVYSYRILHYGPTPGPHR